MTWWMRVSNLVSVLFGFLIWILKQISRGYAKHVDNGKEYLLIKIACFFLALLPKYSSLSKSNFVNKAISLSS